MNVFLFEYATCIGADDSIAVEGLGMFNTLYKEFDRFSNVHSLADEKLNTSKPEEWMKEFDQRARETDYGVVIAPENGAMLLELTIILDGAVINLGSSSTGIYTASDKWLTYLKLNKKTNMPLTSCEPLDEPYLIKPRLSCGGTHIEKIEGNGRAELPEGYIAQEFIQGVDASVSLLVGDDVNVLSVNKQLVDDFSCYGVSVPFKVDEEAIEESIKAVESVKGLFGYVGVDMVIGDSPYVVEVNPRFTTPAILFRDAYDVNIAELLVKNYEGKEIPEMEPKKELTLKKIKGESPQAFAYRSGYSLIKTDTEKN